MTRPKIIPLPLLVALVSAVVASKSIPPVFTLAGFIVAGALSSAGAFVLNSTLEMNVDAQMKRAKNRPLPARRIEDRRALQFALFLLASVSALLRVKVPHRMKGAGRLLARP